MINRALIRIKVVQLLYSYLLVENPFSLISQPSAPTKEKRFAYALYLDTLLLMIKVAEAIQKRGGERPLYDTRFINRIVADDAMRAQRSKYAVSDFQFAPIVSEIADKVKDSGLYKTFLKNPDLSGAEDNIWKNIFDKIILPDEEYNTLITRRQNYTLRGVDRMRGMIEETFTDFFASADHLPDALKTLSVSMNKARELYIRLLQLPVELTALRERQIDEASRKFILTDEDINPNMRFVENEFVKALSEDPELHAASEQFPGSWVNDDPLLLRSLLKDIMESDIYYDYMNFPATDLHTDCEFWKNVYRYIILRNPNFLEALEDKSVFWNDDVDIIGTFVVKTVRYFEDYLSARESAPVSPLLPMFKDQEDAVFGAELFSAVIKKKDAYRNLLFSVIDSKTWEFDRLAFMDVVIMLCAIAEILNFPKIPLNVSFNEYIEIAKAYSSSRSGQFVNGLLAAVVKKLKEDGKLHK